MPMLATHSHAKTLSEVHMSKTAITSPQRLRKAHKASFSVESVSWDGKRFVALTGAHGRWTKRHGRTGA